MVRVHVKYFIGLILLSFLTFNNGCGDSKIKTEHITKTMSIAENPVKKEIQDSKIVKPDNVIKGNYAVALFDTPVLYTKNFPVVYGGKNGRTLGYNKSKLVKELEYVAFPGTVFEILDEYEVGGQTIYKVYDPLYDIVLGGTNLYVDSRFVEVRNEKPEPRNVTLPSRSEIFEFLDKSMGSRYVWGANNYNGVEKMLEFYPPSGKLNKKDLDHWSMTGFDCSGLIYEATNGYTARSTHQMVNYGQGVEIAGKSAEQIADILEPLDMIVWKGHVIYVYDEKTTIESAYSDGGVVKKDLVSVLRSIMTNRNPSNEWKDNAGKMFVVRRWYPGN